MKGPKWRTGYDAEENEAVGRACATVNREASMTQQSFAQDCDINVLVRRFGIDKVCSSVIDPTKYGDFSGAPDLRTALEIMRDAEDKFMHLSPKVRLRFQNSPAALWEFLQDPENGEEALALGLLEKRRPEAVPGEKPAEGGEAPKGPDNA